MNLSRRSWASDTQQWANTAGYFVWEAQHPDYSGAFVLNVVYNIHTYIIYLKRQAHGLKTKACRKMSATRHHNQGKKCLDIHVLKPARVWADIASAGAPGNQQVVSANCPAQGQPGEWVNYAYRTALPILIWLPSNLAEWIGDNSAAERHCWVDCWRVQRHPREQPRSWHIGSPQHPWNNSVGAFQWQAQARPQGTVLPF